MNSSWKTHMMETQVHLKDALALPCAWQGCVAQGHLSWPDGCCDQSASSPNPAQPSQTSPWDQPSGGSTAAPRV